MIVFSPDTILEWSAAPRLTPEPTALEIEPVSGLRLDTAEEVLAQELYSWMYLSGGNLIRDICDLAWAAVHGPPNVMMPAIQAFKPGQFETMLGEMRDQFLPVNRARPIIEPADPLFEFKALDSLCRHLTETWSRLGRAQGGSPR